MTERIQSEALGPVVQVSKVTIAPRLLVLNGGTRKWLDMGNDVLPEMGEGNFWKTLGKSQSGNGALVKIPLAFVDSHLLGHMVDFELTWQQKNATILNFDTCSFQKQTSPSQWQMPEGFKRTSRRHFC